MVAIDTLANALTAITNAEARAKREVVVYPASRLLIEVLRTLQRAGYIGEIEYIDDGRQGKVKVQLLGRINKAGAVKPRHSVKLAELVEMPQWLRRYLPARDMGLLVLSTPSGIMSHREALERRTGGVLVAYVY
ncbi:MAG: 30S ribosomal protein S8 [Fervidicoccaceae archaeon]